MADEENGNANENETNTLELDSRIVQGTYNPYIDIN